MSLAGHPLLANHLLRIEKARAEARDENLKASTE
jgi:hypothetical protein